MHDEGGLHSRHGGGERRARSHAAVEKLVTRNDALRILVVEDEEDVANGIQRVLETNGFHVDVALDGKDGLAKALGDRCDLVILDIMLPTMNGFRVCASLREAGMWAPIVMLSAKSGDWDQAESLDAGADDYLTKPVSMIVLLAHVRALIRRAQLFDARQLSVDGLCLDPVRHCCSDGRQSVDLSAREVEVMAYLMINRYLVVSKIELLSNVWGADFSGDANIVEVYVGHLRKKLEAPFGRKVIDTIRGSGYRLHCEE
jgi:two-component system OmpR family response regulator